MKKVCLLGLAVLIVSCTFLSNVFAQDYTQWKLPEGAKARFGKGWINDIEFSPNGGLISVATTIGIWTYDVHSGKEVNLFTGNMGGANAISYTSDGGTLAAAHWNRTVGLWDVNSHLPAAPYFTFTGHPGPIYAVAISPDNRMVASGGAGKMNRGDSEPSGLIRVWDLQTKELLPILRSNAPVSTLAFSSNSRMLAAGSGDGTIQVWDAGSGDLIHEFKDHEESIWRVDFSPDNKWLLSISLDGTGLLKNLAHPDKELPILSQRGTSLYAASFSPNDEDDEYTFATGGTDKRIQLWHTNTINNDELLPDNSPLEGHNDSVWILAFSKDGQDLASGSLDGTVRLWDLDLLRERFKITGHTGGIKALAYTTDNRILACGSGLDGTLRLWDAGTSSQLSTLLDHAGLNETVTFSSDGRTLASGGSEDNSILLSDVTKILGGSMYNNSLLHSLTGNSGGITALALSYSKNDLIPSVPGTLASGGMDARIHLLNVAKNSQLKTLTGSESTVTALTFDPNGTSLFSGEENGTVRRWDAQTGIEQFNFRSSFNTITALAFSPLGRFLAIGDEVGKIRLFDFVEQSETYIFTEHTRKITSLIFAEDGNTLVSGSEDGTILLWDMNEVLSNIEAEEIEAEEPEPQQHQTTLQTTTTTKHGISPQQIAQTSQKSTVHLLIGDKQGNLFGSGSGFFVRPGYVATNYHVIEKATWIYIKGIGQEKMYVVEGIVATDKSHDLAILKAAEINAPALHLGNSDTVQTGDTVYVVGNPKGYEGTFSKGIVSAIRAEGANTWIQIDASISPGSSGGAVLNSKGEVIGVATAGLPNKDAQNLNFVVPSNYLKTLLYKVK